MADLRTYNAISRLNLLVCTNLCPHFGKSNLRIIQGNKKNAAYEEMINKLKEVKPEATRDTAKKKINSIRSCYRKEKKKVDASIRSGVATEDIYEPSLWYFHLLEFLNDQETPRQSTSNFDYITENGSMEDTTVDSPFSRPLSQAFTSVSDNTLRRPSSYSAPTLPDGDNHSLPPRRMQKRTRNDDTNVNKLINKVGNCITKISQSKPLGRHDIFGQNVAHKLRNMSNEQRIYTEKLINEAIFEGELENLNRNCYILRTSNTNISSHISEMYNTAPQAHNNYNTSPGAMNLDAPTTSASVRNYALNYVP